MAQCFLLCLILVNTFVAVASENAQTMLRSSLADVQHPPAPAPYNNEKPTTAEAPTVRKLGKHQPKVVKTFGSAPASSPSQAPQPEKDMHRIGESPSTGQTAATVERNNGTNVSVKGQTIHLQKHHRSVDKSVAGGGVILGGLATTFLVAVICYIRATGRHKSETHQSTTETTN
ncbi:PREDICTED: uncharacterized protein LOC18597662 [Theobroma cacao]|uniref:Uncharacterized protein LOC18597662 n=1 Tax=Theobroma cacao TaxID=3641 RepID=A0AB32V209_THECC|nr:PREDICTED: uncharacterized protein LOC18597662 [Theobroma cacao]